MGSLGAGRGNSGIKTFSISDYNKVSGDLRFVGQNTIEDEISSELNRNLFGNEQFASVDSFNILTSPEDAESNGGIGEVEAHYRVQLRIPYTYEDSDGITHTDYDEEQEYRSKKFSVQLLEERR